jgi:hypothetical protein
MVLFLGSFAFADTLRLRLEVITGGVLNSDGTVTGGTSSGFVVTDNQGVDANSGLGEITIFGGIGSFTVNVTTGISKPVIPTQPNAYAEIDLLSVNVTTSGAGILRITLEDSDFENGPDGPLDLIATVGGTLSPNSQAFFQSWVSPTNGVPTLGLDAGLFGLPAALGAIGGIPGDSVAVYSPVTAVVNSGSVTSAFALSDTAAFTKSGSYSMFTQATVAFSGGGTVSFDSNLAVLTPEPTSLLLLGSGLASLGLLGRRKKTR